MITKKHNPDVRPGVPMVKREKEALKKEALQKEKNAQNRQKSYKEQERESREAALQSSISSQNKGFALLQKMGYKAGQGLGKQGAGRVEPVPLNIKTGSSLILNSKVRKRTEREERQTQGDLRKSQRACEQLDSQKGITVPRDSWYWPEALKEEEAELLEEEPKPEGSDDEEELTPLDKLQFLTSYLRGAHFYCIWCGTAYNDEEDLSSNCPGDSAADHDD
ncbi:G patch domain-containing protein 11-like [Sinocyclocheilus rhinocerous]|uniref:G patch domain-containing protein 11-like n=1 Tax=Sinocyclocheilus rhinocerous TaxID=307959 RepID=UPI0007BA34E7|nr:PREDICTED: G patch domain-containing protein 11-like [Sinocyclocheilus rhinocerous]